MDDSESHTFVSPESKKRKIDQQDNGKSYAEFPFIRSSRKGPKYVYHSYCRADLNIAHSGKYDIKKHFKTWACWYYEFA